MKMINTNKIKAASLLLSVVVIVIALNYHRQRKLERSTNLIVEIYKKTDLGIPLDSAVSFFKNDRWHKLNYHRLSPSNSILQSEYSFGAVNWDIWLEHTNEIITSVRIRSADNKSFKPKGAPPDKFYEGSRR